MTRRITDIVEMSSLWEAEDMLRNLEEELRRLEQGMNHMVWDSECRLVTLCPCPLPVSPRFQVAETESQFTVSVDLPGVRAEDIEVDADRDSIVIRARHQDRSCRPLLLSVDSPQWLDPESMQLELSEDTLVVTVRKAKKHRVKVR